MSTNNEHSHKLSIQESQSLNHSVSRSRPIHKQSKKKKDSIRAKKQLIHNIVPMRRYTPTYGLFESQAQKYQRLQNFFREQIEKYYRSSLTVSEINSLKQIINKPQKSLKDVFSSQNGQIWKNKLPINEITKYCELIEELGDLNNSLAIMNQKQQQYLVIFNTQGNLIKIIEITAQEIIIVQQRQKFMLKLENKQQQYYQKYGVANKLSQISSQIAFFHELLVKNNYELKMKLNKLYEKVINTKIEAPKMNATNQYLKYLILKNLRKGLDNFEIDYLNFFRLQDMIEHTNKIAQTNKPIGDKKDFQEYVKKKTKRTKKGKSLLKTACNVCFCWSYEMYNPIRSCPSCYKRYHKYCYIPQNVEGYCEECQLRKNGFILQKNKIIQCQLCPNRNFLFYTSEQGLQYHGFCTLINGLWFMQDSILHLKLQNKNKLINNQKCRVCNTGNSPTYHCIKCGEYLHPLCAYLSGFNISLNASTNISQRVSLQCCGEQVEIEKNQKRRKFVLNFKKCVFGQEK